MMPNCLNCGTENPEHARFCLDCGHSLAAPPSAAGEERKMVTVLFCDLVGFTARSDRADPEDIRAALRPYHSLLRKEIEGFGGTVEKFIGDAVMAVFGAPVTHEDDAERAVRACLRILEAITTLNDDEPTVGIAVRIGINTGEALVSLGARPEEGEGIVTGDVVNTASRLQTVAPVGGIVVGEQTYRTTARLFEYEALPPAKVKGKAESLLIWRPISARSRFGVDVDRTAKTPLIGRDDELELLKRTYARSIRESSVQLVTITGEPGVGKTRLVDEFFEFIEELPELVSWRQGRCLPYGDGITFWALGEIVKAQAGILESDGVDEARTKLTTAVEAVVEDPSDRDWILTHTAALVGLRAPQSVAEAERTESFTAWRRLLEAVAARGSLVLIFEDVHWADEAMLSFLEHLVDWSTGVSMLVVCTARPELFENSPGWGGGKRNSATISLGPLSEEETTRLVSNLLARAILPAETQSLVLERAGGNPLYAEEFVRMLEDHGILGPHGELSDGRAEIPVPESIQSLIAARLDTLAAEKKGLLQDASVIGKVFWNGAVAEIGHRPEREVQESLHVLASKELVRPMRVSSVKDESEWVFWHALVRDVAYSQIPRSARVAKHVAAAAWIEGLAGERVHEYAEVLAHHYLEALATAESAGANDALSELRERAGEVLLMAGDRVLMLDAEKANSYYRRALELFGGEDPRRARARVGAAEAAFNSGRFEDAERDFREAISELEKHGDRVGAARAGLKLGTVVAQRRGARFAHEVLLEAIAVLEEERAEPDLAIGYADAARQLFLVGRSDEAAELAGRVLATSQWPPAREATFKALEVRGMTRYESGNLDGIQDLKQALDIARDHGAALQVARVMTNMTEPIWFSEGPAKALECAREAAEFSSRHGLFQEMQARMFSLDFLFELGRWDELLDEGHQLETWFEGRGGGEAALASRINRAFVMVWRGAIPDADSAVEGLREEARAIGEPQILVPALIVNAIFEQAQGRSSRALELIEELRRDTQDLPGARKYRVFALPDVVRICVAANELGLAEQALDDAGTAGFLRLTLASETARAMCREAGGDLEEASRLHAYAAERWTDYGFVLEQGQSALHAGRCLLALDRPGAREWLHRARAIFVSLGARPLLAETNDLLRNR